MKNLFMSLRAEGEAISEIPRPPAGELGMTPGSGTMKIILMTKIIFWCYEGS
ncbi:MAG: hypothetical protein Q7K44_01390 [Candidatus Liptonbacteria bacterium]|nr:hypothetical protein [Candidatus Liptonbacteria bacterium]